MADAPSSNRLFPKGFGPIVHIDFESVPDGNIFHMGAVFQDRPFSRNDIRDVPSALAQLNAMDRVHLVQHGGQVYVKSLDGVAVARLSAKGRRRWEHRLPSIVSARIMGMVTRLATDGQGLDTRGEEKRGEPVEKWEVPVVEILHRR